MPRTSRLLVLFLDGVGIGPPDPEVNPFFRAHLPVLRSLLSGPLPSLETAKLEGEGTFAFPVDALMEMEGLPQSGTGQTSLLTGRNAARLFGSHFGPWTPVSLRPLLETENFLRVAGEAGARVVFANAVPPGYPDGWKARRVAAPIWAARSAGVLHRHDRELARGEAVATEIVNDRWRRLPEYRHLPEVTPKEAGRTLAALSEDADLTFFAHYDTDLAGHRGGMTGATAALERVDAFLGGLLENLPPRTALLLLSDHGNVEDVRVGHTRNPALGLAVGTEILPPSLPAVRGAVLEILGIADHS